MPELTLTAVDGSELALTSAVRDDGHVEVALTTPGGKTAVFVTTSPADRVQVQALHRFTLDAMVVGADALLRIHPPVRVPAVHA